MTDGRAIIPPHDAWRILGDTLVPLPPEETAVDRALGSWLASPITADRDLPPAPRAAMDGFAVRSADVGPNGAELRVVGEVAAGSAAAPDLAPGTCVRIFTGANVSPAADAVVPVEATSSGSFRARPDDSVVTIRGPVRAGDHIFARGETTRAGDVLLAAGVRLGPRQLAVVAATGRTFVSVHRRPRVVVLNTGEELLEPGREAAAHQTRNSNGPFLVAAVAAAGLADVTRRTVPDSPERTGLALAQALADGDAVIITGGISAGRHDYVPEALAAVGVDIAYKGVAIKPGKPQLFGRGRDGVAVFGLPGNPLSTLVGFYEFVLPALRRLAGCPLDACRPALLLPLGMPWRHDGDRALALPARLDSGGPRTVVIPCPPVGSADLVTGGRVDGAILLPPGCGGLEAGAEVRFRPWSEGPAW